MFVCYHFPPFFRLIMYVYFSLNVSGWYCMYHFPVYFWLITCKLFSCTLPRDKVFIIFVRVSGIYSMYEYEWLPLCFRLILCVYVSFYSVFPADNRCMCYFHVCFRLILCVKKIFPYICGWYCMCVSFSFMFPADTLCKEHFPIYFRTILYVCIVFLYVSGWYSV